MKQAKRQLAGSGEALPAGVIGEVLNVSVSGSTSITAGTTVTVQTINNVPPGVYLATSYGVATLSTANTTGYVTLDINGATSGSLTSRVISDWNLSATQSGRFESGFAQVIRVPSTQNIRLNVISSGNGAGSILVSNMQLIRIA